MKVGWDEVYSKYFAHDHLRMDGKTSREAFFTLIIEEFSFSFVCFLNVSQILFDFVCMKEKNKTKPKN